MTVDEKRKLELKTMYQIIGIYCHNKHHTPKGQLCEECQKVWQYAEHRICLLYTSWNNEWIGMERPTPKRERPSGDNAAYLYKGSKVRNLVGGANPTAAGILHPIDARPITCLLYTS